MPETVVTRFAPSPTGYLHVGGARTALFNWLLARHHGGSFLLRIEDTDTARSTQLATDAVLDDLKWLGLDWDNPQVMHQSHRVAVYDKLIDKLIDEGKAYIAWETPEELENMRRQAERARRPFLYKRRNYTPDELKRFADEGRPQVVRFQMPQQAWTFEDAVLGKNQGVGPDQVQDFVIRKADGMPTYHFAVVVDDAEMGITHILRGQEHLLNTVQHNSLQEALGMPRPVYAHLPVILNTDGSKMSKRDQDKAIREKAQNVCRSRQMKPADLGEQTGLGEARIAEWFDAKVQLDAAEHRSVMAAVGMDRTELPEILVHEFRSNGYLPQVLNNFLALLGWNPGGDRERMTTEQLIELFTIDRIGKSNSKFDRAKLQHFNTEALNEASPEQLLPALKDMLGANDDSPLKTGSDVQLLAVIRMNAGMRTLAEAEAKSRFLFIADDAVTYDPKAVEKVLKKGDGHGLGQLREMATLLAGLEDFSASAVEEAVKGHCETTGTGLGKVAQPLRVAVCGSAVSPPIFDCLAFLGKQSTLARIERCLAEAR
ncbi:MAG: glutamate--tRNA ligase [Phycisphaerae bacterium]